MQNAMYLEVIRGYPYKNIEGVANEFGISKRTVQKKLEGIYELIKSGRYSRYAVIHDGKIVLVNMYVFMDYLTYRQQLEDGNMCKTVPPFEARSIAQLCGWET